MADKVNGNVQKRDYPYNGDPSHANTFSKDGYTLYGVEHQMNDVAGNNYNPNYHEYKSSDIYNYKEKQRGFYHNNMCFAEDPRASINTDGESCVENNDLIFGEYNPNSPVVEVDSRGMTEYVERELDLMNGHVVYQVMVDRFAPPSPEALEAKRYLYSEPKKLMSWDQIPACGKWLPKYMVWEQEVEFWGGDLNSLMQKLDYIQDLGVNVLYLTPIFSAATYHGYDVTDYKAINPIYGTMDDLVKLVEQCHSRGIRLILDGSFNHMGRNNPMFQDALNNENSKYRDYFKFTNLNDMGYIGWWAKENHPEINYESEGARNYIYASPDSVISYYMRDIGIDGFRIDAAHDIGYKTLAAMRESARQANPNAYITGETHNYPEGWDEALDGVLNTPLKELVLRLVNNKMSGTQILSMINTMVEDAGIDLMLKSWLLLDGHDVDRRLANMFENDWQKNMALVLQFTLPGSPLVYYGSELGMEGVGDPKHRASMRWDLDNDKNETQKYFKKLLNIHENERALRIGDFKTMNSEKLFAFMRTTDRWEDTVVVVANPTDEEIHDFLMVRDGKIHSHTPFVNLLTGELYRWQGPIKWPEWTVMEVTLKPHEVIIMKPSPFIMFSDGAGGDDRYENIP